MCCVSSSESNQIRTSERKTNGKSNEALLKGKLGAVFRKFVESVRLLLFLVVAGFTAEHELGAAFQVFKGE